MHISAKLGHGNLPRMIRRMRGHCPPDTGFKVPALVVLGRGRWSLGLPTILNLYEWAEKKHFFETWMPEQGSNLLHVMDSPSWIDVRRQESCMGTRTGIRILPATSLPTTEAFIRNVTHSDLQTCIWKSALDQDPPNLDFTQYGWEKDLSTKSMIQTSVPANV